jgi:hypothetical protein
VLSGGENLTSGTLASLATALDARFALDLRPRETGNGTVDATPQPLRPWSPNGLASRRQRSARIRAGAGTAPISLFARPQAGRNVGTCG